MIFRDAVIVVFTFFINAQLCVFAKHERKLVRVCQTDVPETDKSDGFMCCFSQSVSSPHFNPAATQA